MDRRIYPSKLFVPVTAIVTIGALYLGQAILIPIALAGLFSFLLAPIVRRLYRWHLPWSASVVVVVVLAWAMVIGLGYVVTNQMVSVAAKLPEYQGNITKKLKSLRQETSGLARVSQSVQQLQAELVDATASQPATEPAEDESRNGFARWLFTGTQNPLRGNSGASKASAADESQKPMPVRIVSSPNESLSIFATALAALLGPLGTAAIVAVLVILILLRQDDLRDRLIRLTGLGRITVTNRALSDIGTRISRYLLLQLAVNVIYAVPVYVVLLLMGLPNPLLFGLMGVILRFLPYLGAWLTAGTAILVAMGTFEHWGQTLGLVGFFIGVELIINNIVEPWIYGAGTGLSTLAVVVSAVFWAWLWGPVGLILATPLTVCLLVLGKHVKELEFLAILLGSEPALEPPGQFYQRLIISDDEAALGLLETQRDETSLEQVYDEILLPTLSLLDHDMRRGRCEPRVWRSMMNTIGDLVFALGEQDEAKEPTNNEPASQALVLCLSDRHLADRLAATMCAQILQHRGYTADLAFGSFHQPSFMKQIDRPDVTQLCVCMTLRAARTFGRRVMRNLRARFPELPILVTLWDHPEGPAIIKHGLNDAGASATAISLADAVDKTHSLLDAAPKVT